MILIVSANQPEAAEIRRLLAGQGHDSDTLASIKRLASRLEQTNCLAVFLDIDSVEVDNHCIRRLTLDYPAVYFFCMSRDRFHPELKDAICYHIYACLNKPIDPDELTFWMRSIITGDTDSRGPPQ